MKSLIRSLAGAGKPAEVFETSDGSRLLLLPYGARVFGLFAPASDDSFYWLNSALEKTAVSRGQEGGHFRGASAPGQGLRHESRNGTRAVRGRAGSCGGMRLAAWDRATLPRA